MTKPGWDTKTRDLWKSNENEEEEITMIDNEVDRMPHGLPPYNKKQKHNSNPSQWDSLQFRKHAWWENAFPLSLQTDNKFQQKARESILTQLVWL